MLTLAKDKKTGYRIVIAAQPSPSVFHAAEELRRFLGEITGAVFPIAFDTAEQTPEPYRTSKTLCIFTARTKARKSVILR